MDNAITGEPATVSRSGRLEALIVALLCVIFLLNPSGGWIEIPDCLPIVGNLDEVVGLSSAGATPVPHTRANGVESSES